MKYQLRYIFLKLYTEVVKVLLTSKIEYTLSITGSIFSRDHENSLTPTMYFQLAIQSKHHSYIFKYSEALLKCKTKCMAY